MVFDEDTPHDVIAALQPDVLVKGADWADDAIVGRDIVEARGGRVVRVPIEPGYSTTAHHRAKIQRGPLDWNVVPTSTLSIFGPSSRPPITRSGMDVPRARGVRPDTAPRKALFVAAAAHGVAARRRAVRRPDRRRPRAGGRRRPLLPVGARRAVDAAAAERAVLPFPSHEVDPYRGLAPHVGVTSARARALHALATGTARVVVASAAALLPRVSAPDRLLPRRSI